MYKCQGESMKKVGPYYISNKVLGEGACSKVYLGQTDCEVIAVKVIPRNSIEGEKCFDNQVKALKQCQNQNIVHLKGAMKSENNFYLFLEYCEGGNLSQFIHRKNILPEQQALALFQQILLGLDALRIHNIIHRDIKPTNILLNGNKAKIGDFGLAHKTTQMSSFAGTKYHMAPEIIQGKSYTNKVDVYSAGVIFYEMLFGKVPFRTPNAETMIVEIKKGLVLPTNTISQPVQILLKSMLESDPNKRIDIQLALQSIKTIIVRNQEKRVKNCFNSNYSNIFMPLGTLFAACKMPLVKTPCNMDMRLYNKLCTKIQDKISILS